MEHQILVSDARPIRQTQYRTPLLYVMKWRPRCRICYGRASSGRAGL